MGNSNLAKTRVVYELILQPSPVKGASDPDYKKEYSLRRLEKMQFPTKDEEFKRRLLKGGGKIVEPVKLGDMSGRDKDRSKEKDKERRERDRDKDKYKKEKRDSDKHRDREKEKQREKERLKEKGTEEKPKPAKPKSDFTELFGAPIKKETKKEKEEREIKKEKDIKKEDIKKEKTSSSSSLT